MFLAKFEEVGNGGYDGRIVGCCIRKTDPNEAVWSGIVGFPSFNTSDRLKVLSNAVERPVVVSQTASQCFWSQFCPNPFVARANSKASRDRSCFEGCRK